RVGESGGLAGPAVSIWDSVWLFRAHSILLVSRQELPPAGRGRVEWPAADCKRPRSPFAVASVSEQHWFESKLAFLWSRVRVSSLQVRLTFCRSRPHASFP